MATKKQNGERRGQRGSQAFTRCGFDDRATAVEFQHIGLREFNRACERFLEEREPNYAKTQIRRGGRGGKFLSYHLSPDSCPLSPESERRLA